MTWIVIVAGYTLGMGLFHLFGGLRSASEAFERWGRAVAESRRASLTSSG